MTEQQEALVRTAKPLTAGTVIALAVYLLFQLFTPMQLVFGLMVFVAIYFVHFVYEMNLDTVRRERAEQ